MLTAAILQNTGGPSKCASRLANSDHC